MESRNDFGSESRMGSFTNAGGSRSEGGYVDQLSPNTDLTNCGGSFQAFGMPITDKKQIMLENLIQKYALLTEDNTQVTPGEVLRDLSRLKQRS